MDNQSKYIETRMKEFAINIDEFEIGQVVYDLAAIEFFSEFLDTNIEDFKNFAVDFECVITNKTRNSIQVFIKKKKKLSVIDKLINEMNSISKNIEEKYNLLENETKFWKNVWDEIRGFFIGREKILKERADVIASLEKQKAFELEQNSKEYQEKITNEEHKGIDCKEWFTMKEFNQKFKKL